MLINFVTHSILWIISVGLSTLTFASPNNNLQVRNVPGISPDESLQILGRALSAVKRDIVYKNSTKLDRSWDGATLLSITGTQNTEKNITLSLGVEIVCTTCYIKGIATAQFTMAESFNISQAIQNVTTQVGDAVSNVTSEIIDAVKTEVTDLANGNFDVFDGDFPPIPFPDIYVPQIPECLLRFQFDGLELYMELDTTLTGGATYTLSLYKSKSPIGFNAGKELDIGITFTVDLILSVEGKIDISSGFHILLKDGIAINLPMFSDKVHDITFNGGHFEFLPVTIQSAGIVLSALLRVGAQAALEVGTPFLTAANETIGASAGIVAGVFADVAQLTTNVTITPPGDKSGCALRVEEVYSMALGAKAGASVAIGAHTWGPQPSIQTAIFFTTLADKCAISATPTPVISARAVQTGLTTTKISTKITYTVVACLVTGMVNCPVSSQTTSRHTVTSTLTTAVASGVTPTFPTTLMESVATTIAFGKDVKDMGATKGAPSSYIPSPTAGIQGILNEVTGGVSNKVIVGVGVGVGLPVLLAIIAGAVFCCRRRRYTRVQRGEVVDGGFQNVSGGVPNKKMPVVSVAEK